jgi:hypothetical protein
MRVTRDVYRDDGSLPFTPNGIILDGLWCMRPHYRRGYRMLFLSALLVVTLAACGRTGSIAPHGWKTVRYSYIEFSVPGTWKVVTKGTPCNLARPTVIRGARFDTVCALSENSTQVIPHTTFSAVVLVGISPMFPPTSPGVWHKETINGVTCKVYRQYGSRIVRLRTTRGAMARTATQNYVTIEVLIPGKNIGLFINAGESSATPGGAPGRAPAILGTLRPRS